MNILIWIILGLVAGWIASVIAKTNQGVLMDIILGVAGAIVGGLIMNFFGQPSVSGFNIYSVIVAVVGSIVLIWIGRLVYK